MHERESSRQLAKTTIAEVYNAQEGMDDDMFEDAAELVGILGRMMKRGLGSDKSSSTPGVGTSEPGGRRGSNGSSTKKKSPPRTGGGSARVPVSSSGMGNPF
jgi:hypothetical protein